MSDMPANMYEWMYLITNVVFLVVGSAIFAVVLYMVIRLATPKMTLLLMMMVIGAIILLAGKWHVNELKGFGMQWHLSRYDFETRNWDTSDVALVFHKLYGLSPRDSVAREVASIDQVRRLARSKAPTPVATTSPTAF